jgi:hypothetical protein
MVRAKDLLKIQKEREKKKIKLYKKVHLKVEKKIVLSSNTNYYECWYSVPEFIMGMPLYKLSYCIKYIVNRLEKDGFKVQVFEPNLLYISWKEEEENNK